MSKAIKPTKTELARFKVMSDLGLTPNAIGSRMDRDPKTVRKYLQSEVYNDPEITRMVTTIREKEIADLYLLGAKARNRLHELIDEGQTKTIETVALMDRSFQQRRLLEGESTQNINTVTADIRAVREYLANRDKE
ncbi:MAG: hypothetical protein JXA79_05055 [Deltaproteobacteria bacterium]|nr:hypothetical protein [Deltaproteobacteria bacterium]